VLFLDQEGGSQKATLVFVLLVVISSLKALLIRDGAQQNFAYTFDADILHRSIVSVFFTHFLINE